MLTADYYTIYRNVADLAGVDRTEVPTREGSIFQQLISKRLATAWEYYPWPELMNVEQRWFRADWDSSATYAASTATTAVEVFYPPLQKYYQSTKGTNTNKVPGTDTDYWAESLESYSGTDWADATAYAVGDIVRRPSDYQWYYCITAHTSSGSFNASNFCILTPFDRYISLTQTGETEIGDVVDVFSKNPLLFYDAAALTYMLTVNGINVTDDCITAWVWFKDRAPQLIGDTFSATATYTASLSQVYYRSSSTPESYPGNFYNCITNTSAGDSPESAAAKWSIVSIPRMFQRYLEWGAYSDWLVTDGQTDKAMAANGRADGELAHQIALVGVAQQQVRRSTVLTR